jgi:hypothetical protein
VSGSNDNAGGRGRAIKDLITWLRSEDTARALEAMQLLDLTDEDLELLFSNEAPSAVRRIPFLGKVR